MNKITKRERDRIYSRAGELLAQGLGLNEITARLIDENQISRDRARNAAARAIRISRRPQEPRH